MPSLKRYNLAHTLTEVITMPLVCIIFISTSYGFFSHSDNSVVSITLTSILYIVYFGVLYYYVCPHIHRKGSIVSVVLYLLIFVVSSTAILFIFFRLHILHYPPPHSIYGVPALYICSIFAILGLTVYLSAFGIYLIQNTYLISIESFHLLQKSYQSEINALRLQMNPHYISNALNNLSHMIRSGSMADAIKYNNKLIDLMKEQMKFVNADTISVQDELSWIEYYFRMEQQRLQYRFSYHIRVEHDELYQYLIPPMLLQPVIENSITHGFNPAVFKGEGVISISISRKTKNEISIRIADNGAGIYAVPIQQRERPSISTENIQLRINLINETKLFHIKRTQDINEHGALNIISISTL